VETAGSTETDAVRAALEGLSWETPQGVKTIRAGDHQAIQPMYVVQIKDGAFTITKRIEGKDAIGEDTCDRF
jgi:branched-chain amino acid transport system substrate-binding protein